MNYYLTWFEILCKGCDSMDFPTIVTAISTVGFPVICCIGMGWYVKYSTDRQREDTKELNAQHSAEMLAFKDEIKDALNNNTIALTKLCEKLDKEA